jgi:hypothetical protein
MLDSRIADADRRLGSSCPGPSGSTNWSDLGMAMLQQAPQYDVREYASLSHSADIFDVLVAFVSR